MLGGVCRCLPTPVTAAAYVHMQHATRPCDLSGLGSTCNTVRSPTARCAISTGGRLVFGWSLSSDGTLEGPRSVGAGIGTSAYSSSTETNE